MKIGIDIGGSHIAIGLVNEQGKIIAKKEKNLTSCDKENIYHLIEENTAVSINELLRENNIKHEDLEMIGIACPGTTKEGVIVKTENLGIYNFNIVEKLQRYFSAPIKLENDAKCAGLCEKSFGALNEYEDCVFLCLGTGIGSAVFLNGKQLKPKRYSGMEIGHTVIKVDGEQCSCGRKGCFETYASMKKLRDKIAKRLNLSEELSGEIIFEFAKRNLDKIDDIIEEFSSNLVEGITNIVNIFEPEAICIGGSYVYHIDVLEKRVMRKLNESKTFNHEIPKIVLAKFENDAGIIGATLL